MKSGRHTLQLISALAVLLLLLAPICLPSPFGGAHAAGTPNDTIAEESLIQQIAEQDGATPDASDGAELSDGLANGTGVWPTPPTTDTYSTIRWLIQAPGEVVENTIPGAVQFLVDFLRDFVLNPNIAIDGVGQTDNGLGQLVAAISPQIKAISQIMYAIAIDLLLLLFILAIWRYWIEAAWRGGGNHFAPIARLIFTAGIITAWPTIYAFEVELSNEMIHAIFFKTPDELAQLGHAISVVIAGIISALVGLALQVIGPLVGTLAALPLGPFAPILGGFIGFVGGLLFLIPGTIIILELVAIIVLKSIQTCVLVAQYMFAPVFLVFFASPDTEYIPKTFVKSFIEVSMWTFVWVGLLRILVVVMNSNSSIWAEFLLVIGVLQMMLSAPEFMGRAHISPVSELLTAGLLIRGLSRGAQNLGGIATDSLNAFNKMTSRGAIGGQRNTGAATSAPIVGAALAGGVAGAAVAGAANQHGQQLMLPGMEDADAANQPPRQGQQTAAQRNAQQQQTAAQQQANARTGTSPQQLAFPFAQGTGTTPPRQGPGANGATNPDGPDVATSTGGRAMAEAAGAGDLLTKEGTPIQPGHLNAMAHSNWTGKNMMGAFLRVFGARSLYGLGIRFGPSPDGNAHFEADPRTGEITNMNTPVADPGDRDSQGRLKPESASARREAGWRLVAGMANHVATDSTEGKQAAREAAIASGAMRPQNAREKLMEASLRSQGQRFEDTDLAKQHLAQGMHAQTISGIQDYLNGKQGNAVTDYFRRTHGENRAGLTAGVNGVTKEQADEGNAFQPMIQNLLRREADSRNPDSGINPDQRGISSLLDPNGYQPNNLTRAVGANPFLRQLPKGLQRAAFEGAWDCMTGIQARADSNKRSQTMSAANPQGVGLTDDEVIDLWHETAPFFGESKIRAMMSMRNAGVSTSNPQQVQDVAEIGQAMGGAIPAYASAVGVGVGLASSLGGLRDSLRANPGANGATLGELVMRTSGMGLDLKDPEVMQRVSADVESGTPITPQRAQAIMAIQASHRAGTTIADNQMVADVAEVGRIDGNYQGAVGIVGDLGTAGVRAALAGGGAHSASYGGSTVSALAMTMSSLGYNPRDERHRQAFVSVVAGQQQDVNRASIDTQLLMQQTDAYRGASADEAVKITQVAQALGGGDMRNAIPVYADLSHSAIQSMQQSSPGTFGTNGGETVTRMNELGMRPTDARDRRTVLVLAQNQHELTRSNVDAVVQLQNSGGSVTHEAIAGVASIAGTMGSGQAATTAYRDLSSVPNITSMMASNPTWGGADNYDQLAVNMHSANLNPNSINDRRVLRVLASNNQSLTAANVETVIQIEQAGGTVTQDGIQGIRQIASVTGGDIRTATAVYNDIGTPLALSNLQIPRTSDYPTNLADAVVIMPSMGLNASIPNHRRTMKVLLEGNSPLNRASVDTLAVIEARQNTSGDSGWRPSAGTMQVVSNVGQTLGGRPSDYATAYDVQRDWGNLAAVEAPGGGTDAVKLSDMVVHARSNRLDVRESSIRQAVRVLYEGGGVINESTAQAIVSVHRMDPHSHHLTNAANISAIAEIGSADGGRPQNYSNAVGVLDSTFNINEGLTTGANAIPATPATSDQSYTITKQLHSSGVNVSHPNVQRVVVETIQNEPAILTDATRMDVVMKSIVLAARSTPANELNATDVKIAEQIIDETSKSNLTAGSTKNAAGRIAAQLQATTAKFPDKFDPNAPDYQRNMKFADIAMKNFRDELAGKPPPRRF